MSKSVLNFIQYWYFRYLLVTELYMVQKWERHMFQMNLSRQEVNLRRLLAKCELMCKNNQKNDERFPKYVSSLEGMLLEVKKLIEPSNDVITSYHKRINAIKIELGMEAISYANDEIIENMREDLMGIRQRTLDKCPQVDDLDQIINYHENLQSKITGDMLILTRNLKEQSQTANKIIKNQTDVVSKSALLTEQNLSKLAIEKSKLEDHSKKAMKCWMWIMLIVVMVVFINMVLFMKVIKKKY